MSLRADREDRIMTAHNGESLGNRSIIRVEYSLCNAREELEAVACYGSRVNDDGTESVAVLTNQVADEVSADDHDIISLGPNKRPGTQGVFVPVVAQVLETVSLARVGMGWSGYVVGSGVRLEVLMRMGPYIGARSLLRVDTGEIAGMTRAGPQLFITAGLDNRQFAGLLNAVPERSVVAPLDHITGAPTPVNFYQTIHKKSLTLVGGENMPRNTVFASARDLFDLRLATAMPELPVHPVSSGEPPNSTDSPAVIVEWSRA